MAKKKELTSRQKQAIDSKNKLVKAATDLFVAQGFQNTTVQDICSRAGMSVGVFYHYFPSKHDALLAVQHQKSVELMHYIDTESTSTDHISAILEVFGFIARQQSTGPFELVANSFAPAFNKVAKGDERLRNFILEIIRSAQESGELTNQLDSEVICDDLLISARGFVFYWCERGGSFDLLPAHQAYLRRILRAYAEPNAKP